MLIFLAYLAFFSASTLPIAHKRKKRIHFSFCLVQHLVVFLLAPVHCCLMRFRSRLDWLVEVRLHEIGYQITIQQVYRGALRH